MGRLRAAISPGGEYMIEKAKEIMNILESKGYEAVMVGGCVRDKLLGLQPKDYDIATNAIPSKVIEIMKENGVKTIPTGLDFGTVTAMLDSIPFEITTYREDAKYSDRRHPDSVSYANTINEDLSRRDFTINSMAMTSEGTIIDPFDGKKDIEKGIIRCVGNPSERFREDPLRILRGIRFAAKYGFSIDYTTRIAMGNCSMLIGMISQERIFNEIKQILKHGRSNLAMFRRCNVMHMILPELCAMYDFEQNNSNHNLDLLKHTDRVIDGVEDVTLKLAAMLHDSGKPACKTYNNGTEAHYYGHEKVSAEIAENVLSRLKASNEEIELVVSLIKYHDAELTDKTVKRLAGKYGRSFVESLILLQKSDKLAQVFNPDRIKKLEDISKRLDEILLEPHNFKSLAVNGYDLMLMGIEEGPQIGVILNALLELVLEVPSLNEKDKLINIIKIFEGDEKFVGAVDV